MPELPEVESIRSTIEPMILGKTIKKIEIHNPKLRWPVNENLNEKACGLPIKKVERRAKHLIISNEKGSLYVHFGMSGSLVKHPSGSSHGKHDHVEFHFDDFVLRYNDVRRFGSIEWQDGPIQNFHRFQKIGPEPLSSDFDANYLISELSKRRVSIKTSLMQHRVVAGIGNIYANEALYHAGINPMTSSATLKLPQIERLVKEIKKVLRAAINSGGSSLKDYVDADGKSGRFQDSHQVYGRAGALCYRCSTTISSAEINARATFWCATCQDDR